MQKIKVKIHTLASDTDCGTNCLVFTNQSDLHDHLRSLMEDCDDEQLKELLATNKVEEAWDRWADSDNKLHDWMDTYNLDEVEIEIEIPKPKVTIEITKGIADVSEVTGGEVDITIIDHDTGIETGF